MPVVKSKKVIKWKETGITTVHEEKGQGHDLIFDEQKSIELFSYMYDSLKMMPDVYTFTGLLAKLEIPASRVYRILDRYKEVKILREFKQSIDKVLESRIAEDGIRGKTNAAMSIFALKNKHGWKDKQEIENTHTLKTAVASVESLQRGFLGNGKDEVIDIEEKAGN